MSAAGFEGCDDVLGEDHGLLDAWGTEGGAETVVRGLGQDYAVSRSPEFRRIASAQ